MTNLKFTGEVTTHGPTSCCTRFRNIAISITTFALGLGLTASSDQAQSNNSENQKEINIAQETATPRSNEAEVDKGAIRPFRVNIPEEAPEPSLTADAAEGVTRHSHYTPVRTQAYGELFLTQMTEG